MNQIKMALDYDTNEPVGAASLALIAASAEAGDVGAVPARLFASRGEWIPVDPQRVAELRREGIEVRTVYVLGASS